MATTTLHHGKLREDGPFAFESVSEVAPDGSGFRFHTVECWTVYADSNQPSHCVRLWQWQE